MNNAGRRENPKELTSTLRSKTMGLVIGGTRSSLLSPSIKGSGHIGGERTSCHNSRTTEEHSLIKIEESRASMKGGQIPHTVEDEYPPQHVIIRHQAAFRPELPQTAARLYHDVIGPVEHRF